MGRLLPGCPGDRTLISSGSSFPLHSVVGISRSSGCLSLGFFVSFVTFWMRGIKKLCIVASNASDFSEFHYRIVEVESAGVEEGR